MPLVNRTFDQLIDFTRTSAATFVGSNGFIQSTPASRNLLTFTEEFDNAAWVKTNATVTANTTVSPDGTANADRIVENTAAGAHAVGNSAGTVSATETLSIYAKPAGRTWIALQLGAGVVAYYDIQNGVLGSVTGGTATITAVGNGWYRCTATGVRTTNTNNLVYVASANNTVSYTGDGTSGIFLWGAQLELGSTATDYTRNFGGLFPPRFDYDPVTLAPRGLLIEEQRTNLLLRSEEFDNASWAKAGTTVTANAIVSPDGTVDADALVEDASTGLHLTQQFFTFLNATAYTFSIYVRPSTRTWVSLTLPSAAFGAAQGGFFDLTGAGALGNTTGTPTSRSITAVGGGWYRLTVTATSTAAAGGNIAVVAASANGTTSYAGNSSTAVHLYGAQLEAGAFATSYIPTVASQVTRAPDIAAIAAPNFASWFNQTEGTLVASVARLAIGTADAISATLFADGNNIIELFAKNTDSRVLSIVGGVTQVNLIDAGKVSASVPYTSGVAYRLNDYALATNAGTVLTDTSATVPTVTILGIGSRSGALPFNGHIRSIRYYPTRLSNAQLQALTA